MLKRGLLFFSAALLLTAASCGASAPDNSSPSSSTAAYSQYSIGQDSGAYLAESSVAHNAADSKTYTDAPERATADRKVIQTASFELETKEYPETMRSLEQQIAATGSYIQRSSSYGDPEQGSARTELTIRVPEQQFETFKQFLPTIGNVVSSTEGGEDVTTQYFDTEARLKVLKAQEDRLLALLDKAATVEEMLQIENELARVRTEIEQLTTTLQRYDDLVSYATVSLYVSQTRDYTIPDDGFFSKLGKTIQDSFLSVVGVLQTAVFAFIWALPYLLFAFMLFLIVRFAVKKRRSRISKPLKPSQNLPSTEVPPSTEPLK